MSVPAPGRSDLLALEPLLETDLTQLPRRGGHLPDGLRARFGGDLAIPLRLDRPTVIANFVSTLDGVVSYHTAEAAGGGEISGFFEPDRFVMGLLRAMADVVLIGAGTLRAAPDEAWTAGYIHPGSHAEFAALRRRLGLGAEPITAVVSGSGDLDLSHPGLSAPGVETLVLTGDVGARRLRRQPPRDNLRIVSLGCGPLTAAAIVNALFGARAGLILCEGGPHLFGQLLQTGLVDELFLTLAPQLAGRTTDLPRLALLEGSAFDVAGAPWARLAGLRRAGDHLFVRYRLTSNERMKS